MSKSRKTIADHAVEYMQENGLRTLAWGDLEELQEVAYRAIPNCRNIHPLTQFNRVLNALGRDKRFKKGYFLCCGVSERERRCRHFTLLKPASTDSVSEVIE